MTSFGLSLQAVSFSISKTEYYSTDADSKTKLFAAKKVPVYLEKDPQQRITQITFHDEGSEIVIRLSRDVIFGLKFPEKDEKYLYKNPELAKEQLAKAGLKIIPVFLTGTNILENLELRAFKKGKYEFKYHSERQRNTFSVWDLNSVGNVVAKVKPIGEADKKTLAVVKLKAPPLTSLERETFRRLVEENRRQEEQLAKTAKELKDIFSDIGEKLSKPIMVEGLKTKEEDDKVKKLEKERQELFNQVQKLVGKNDFEGAKQCLQDVIQKGNELGEIKKGVKADEEAYKELGKTVSTKVDTLGKQVKSYSGRITGTQKIVEELVKELDSVALRIPIALLSGVRGKLLTAIEKANEQINMFIEEKGKIQPNYFKAKKLLEDSIKAYKDGDKQIAIDKLNEAFKVLEKEEKCFQKVRDEISKKIKSDIDEISAKAELGIKVLKQLEVGLKKGRKKLSEFAGNLVEKKAKSKLAGDAVRTLYNTLGNAGEAVGHIIYNDKTGEAAFEGFLNETINDTCNIIGDSITDRVLDKLLRKYPDLKGLSGGPLERSGKLPSKEQLEKLYEAMRDGKEELIKDYGNELLNRFNSR